MPNNPEDDDKEVHALSYDEIKDKMTESETESAD